MSPPALSQPQLRPAGITCDQYLEFTLEKLELVNGHLGYGEQDQTGFHSAEKLMEASESGDCL